MEVLKTEEIEEIPEAVVQQLRRACEQLALTRRDMLSLDWELETALPDYDARKAELTKKEQSLRTAIRETVSTYYPSGGVRFAYGDLPLTLSQSSPRRSVCPEKITPELLEQLESIEVDGQPVLVWSISVPLVEEAARRGKLDLSDLEDAGVLITSLNSPKLLVNYAKAEKKK